MVLNTPTTDDRIQFYKRKGFIEKERIYGTTIDLDLTEVSKWEINHEISSYTARLATKHDQDHIIEVFQADMWMKDVFPSEKEARYLLESSISEDSHSHIIHSLLQKAFEINSISVDNFPLD